MGEYFGGEDTVRVSRPEDDAVRPRELASYLSRCLEPGEGVHVLVSYHAKPDPAPAAAVEVDPWDRCRVDGQTAPSIELGAMDFIKLCARNEPGPMR